MNNLELYDKRFDWLAPSLLALPLTWFFYGLDAALLASVLFILLGALKPVRQRLGTNLAPGMLAAGVILLASPSLRFMFYDGYCFEGPGSPLFGLPVEEWTDVCTRSLFALVRLDVWKGPLRDFVMPLAGLGLVLLALANSQPNMTGADATQSRDADGSAPPSKVRRLGWLVLIVSCLAWICASYLNYQNDLSIAEEERKAAVAQRLKEQREEKAAVARKLEKERLAKQVTRKWLLGSWVATDNINPDIRYRPDIYCSTDSGVMFNAGGDYSWAGDEGRYVLSDGKVRLTDRIRYDIGGSDPPQKLKPTTSAVYRDGEQLVIDGEEHSRC